MHCTTWSNMVKHRSHVCWQVAVEVNTTQEALCCQSSAPNQKLCQANTTCIIKVGGLLFCIISDIYCYVGPGPGRDGGLQQALHRHTGQQVRVPEPQPRAVRGGDMRVHDHHHHNIIIISSSLSGGDLRVHDQPVGRARHLRL